MSSYQLPTESPMKYTYILRARSKARKTHRLLDSNGPNFHIPSPSRRKVPHKGEADFSAFKAQSNRILPDRRGVRPLERFHWKSGRRAYRKLGRRDRNTLHARFRGSFHGHFRVPFECPQLSRKSRLRRQTFLFSGCLVPIVLTRQGRVASPGRNDSVLVRVRFPAQRKEKKERRETIERELENRALRFSLAPHHGVLFLRSTR